MSLLHISDNFKTYLKEPAGDKKYLAYVDFRQQLYPPITGHGLTFHAFPDNLIDRGHCEASSEPMANAETTAVTSNATWVQSSADHYRGNYSWLLTKTSEADAGDAVAYLVDNTDTDDLHGFEAGKKYRYSLKAKTSDHTNYAFQIYEYSGASWNELVSDACSASDAWETISGTFEIPLDSTALYIRQYIASAADIAETAYVDEIKIDEENQTGSHIGYFGNLASDPHPQWCLDIPDYFTFWIRCKPYFAYNVGTDITLFSWYVSATQEFSVRYDASDDKFVLEWEDGGTSRTLESQQYDDGSSYSDINQWIDIVGVIDLRTGGRTTGSSFWTDWTKRDEAWSGNHDAITTNFPLLNIGHYNGNQEWDGEVAFVKFWPNKVATATEIGAYFRTVKEEEIYFPLNGHGVGHTRCNISDKVLDMNIELTKKSRGDAWIANKGGLNLNNHDGIFSDDQYASFVAASEQYNGTATQAYMQQRCGVEIEALYTTEQAIEPLFTGRTDDKGFARRSDAGKSRVNLGFADIIDELQNVGIEKSVYYEDYKFCDPTTETESLVHLITRLATAPKVYNFASNSGFENATIGNSWANTNLSAWTRESGGLFGSYCGRMVYDAVEGGTQDIYQTIMFNQQDGHEKINPGEKWTFSIYLKSASACSNKISIDENDSGGNNNSTEATYTIAGGEGSVRFNVTHEITDSDSDRLIIRVEMDDNVTLDVDGAMLVRSEEAYNWFILNADDGSSASYEADDAITNDRYDTYDKCGFDTVESALVHPWAVVLSNKPAWNKLGDLAEAILARSMGIDCAGTMRYRSRYEEDDGDDPSAIADITDSDVPEVSSNIERKTHNHTIIRGAKIKKMSDQKLMWSVFGSSIVDYSHGQLTPLTISDGDYWPDPDEYTDEFLARFKTGPTEEAPNYQFHRDWLQDIDDHTMIGAKSVVAHISVTDTDGIDDLNADFTQIFFDVLPDGVKIKYRNDSGETMNLYMYALYGKPIYKIGGKNAVSSGFVHDYFKDANDIRKNGEKVLKIANDFLISKTQIDKVAEYHWKERLARHQYRQSLQGNRLYFLPGEWCNVDVGSAGFHEYLDYKGEFREIHWSWNAKGEERSDVIIDEQSSNWKAESNYSARFEEYGHPYKEPDAQGQTIVVASSESADIANMYCDGTSDEDEINAAINQLAAIGGGTVILTHGIFYITDDILLKTNVQIIGQGVSTNLKINTNNKHLRIQGAFGSEITGVRLANFSMTRDPAYTTETGYIYCSYAEDCEIEKIYAINSTNYICHLGNCNYIKIKDCIFDDADSGNAALKIVNSDDNQITNVTCRNSVYTGVGDYYCAGIEITDSSARNILLGCTLNNNDWGVFITSVGYCIVNTCIIYSNVHHGIAINKTDFNKILGCEIYDNGEDGIKIYNDSNDNTTGDNTIYNNGGTGINIT